MARAVLVPLHATEVKKLSKQVGRHLVGGVTGLALNVQPSKIEPNKLSASWVLRVQRPNLKTNFGLGAYGDRPPSVTLEQARAKAREYWEIINQGIDPRELETKRKAQLMQMAEEEKQEELSRLHSLSWVFEQYVRDPSETAKWKNAADTVKKKASWFNGYIRPILGEMPISEISGVNIKALGDTKQFQAVTHASRKKIKAVLSGLFEYAEGRGWLPEGVNPLNTSAARNLFRAPKDGAPTKKQGALEPEQVPEFVADVAEMVKKGEERGHTSRTAQALLFAILTNSRANNVLKCEWQEIDLEKRTWTIPAQKMKQQANRAHTVMLTDEAIRILKMIPKNHPRYRQPGAPSYVFIGNRGEILGPNAMRELVKDINDQRQACGKKLYLDERQTAEFGEPVKVTQHGISRASFRTWIQENSFNNADGTPMDGNIKAEAAELNLHHKKTDIVTNYARSDLSEQRRILSEAWAKFCFSQITDIEEYFPLKV